MNTSASLKRSPLKFFLLIFVISTPFWLMGSIAEQKLPLPFNLPVGALVLVCPMIAALILVCRENGYDGVKKLLRRSFDFKRIKKKIWYIPIFFLMPAIIILEFGLMKLMGISIPDFQFPVLMVPVFFVVFFIGAICEEISWTGYVTDPLQDRWNALRAGITLGIVCGQCGTSRPGFKLTTLQSGWQDNLGLRLCYEFLLSGFITIPEKAYSQRSHSIPWLTLVNWFCFPFTVHITTLLLLLSSWQSRLQ